MKKLILTASASPQRRKLMKILGLPFVVSPSRAQEITRMTRGCAHLVKTNASLKSPVRWPQRLKEGIVIGSDTVVLSSRGRLILKPRDLKEAKKNLKDLMAHPHWVYSGVAIVDAKTGRQEIGVEKTKVFHDEACPDKAPLTVIINWFLLWIKQAVLILKAKELFLSRVLKDVISMWWVYRWRELAQMLKKFDVSVLMKYLLVMMLLDLIGACPGWATTPRVCHLDDCVSMSK